MPTSSTSMKPVSQPLSKPGSPNPSGVSSSSSSVPPPKPIATTKLPIAQK